jgi:hypothetical protein
LQHTLLSRTISNSGLLRFVFGLPRFFGVAKQRHVWRAAVRRNSLEARRFGEAVDRKEPLEFQK